MVELPAGEMRAGDGPLPASAVGGEEEGAFAGSDEETNVTHGVGFSGVGNVRSRPGVRRTVLSAFGLNDTCG